MSKLSSAGWRYSRSGPIGQVLKYEKFDLAPVKDGAVVQMVAAPLHRVDAAVVNGSALGRKRVNMGAFPRIGGCEGVGKVVHPGGSTAVKAGDMVWVAPLHGTWATTITVPPDHIHRINPAHRHLAVTASNFLVAQQLLQGYAPLQKGDVVVQNGGSSLTALAVSALGQAQGVTVLTATTPGDRFAAAKQRHAKYGSEVFEYNGAGARAMRAALTRASPANGVYRGGAALYLNGVGGRSFDTFLQFSGPMSHVVTYGAQNSFGLFLSGSNLIYNEVTMQGLFAPTYLAAMSYKERQTKLDFVLSALSDAKLEYPTVAAASLEKLPEVWDEVYVKGGRKAIVSIAA